MPSVSSASVKNTGYGQITYTNQSNGVTTGTPAGTTTSSETIVNTVNGENIGTGYGLFAGTNGTSSIMLDFKTIIAGSGISISDNGFALTLSSTGGGGGGGGSSVGGPSDGFSLNLGNTTLFPGAAPLTANTSVSNAIESLNSILALLVPSAPPNFPNGTLSIINTSGNTPLLASGVPDHASSSLVAGQAVTRVTTGPSTNTFSNVGPGNTGTLQLLVNGGIVGSHIMTGTGDNGNYNGLVISGEASYPVNQPGFYTSFNVAATNASSPNGINNININHTAAGSTNTIFYVLDSLVSTPVISNGSVSLSANGTLAYSSSVPHFGTGGSLIVNASYNNIAGQTYYGGGTPFIVTGTNNIFASQAFSYQNIGISTPIPQNTISTTALSPLVVNVNGQTHGSGNVQGLATNVNGSSATTTLSSNIILVKNGIVPTGKVDELNVPVIGLGTLPNANNAIRVSGIGNGDTPNGAISSFDPTAALQSYDAAVVAGVLSNNQTNYSVNYIPPGPNLSLGRNVPQYIDFSFNKSSVSVFNINVTGTYAGCWVKLTGVSDNSTISPNAVNGWWNAFVSYIGAGVPGNPSDLSAGCASGNVMNGSSGSFTITFGPQTSTNAIGNTILVRIRLNAGQSITALSFSN
jgi:hypothetical protein